MFLRREANREEIGFARWELWNDIMQNKRMLEFFS
jgi:hypothetical protein